MSGITFSENHESLLVAFEDGTALACLSDPLGEGLKWSYSLGFIPTSDIVVIGLGSGFHIAALADLDPNLNITVIESRESLIPVFRSQFPDIARRIRIAVIQNERDLFNSEAFQEAVARRSFILSFRECWARQSTLFSKLFGHLTGRSEESVRYHFEDLGIDIKALSAQLIIRPDTLASIKHIQPLVEVSNLAENKKQIFRVLGELVK
ncbi:MAG: hypothetical protein ACXVCY_14590 [Pseudobdellovibrionaceae bacterium]